LNIDPSSIFVVVPAYNEASVIRQTVEKLLRQKFSVVVVDDASSDNTRNELLGLAVYYIRHLSNLGQGAALRTGIELALIKNAAYIVSFDADGQHDVADIEKMTGCLISDKLDIVFGSRFVAGAATNAPVFRKLVLRTARFINYLASGILLTDANNGLRMMTRDTALKMKITENRSSHNAQVQNLVHQHQLKYAECPVNISYSDYSRKKGVQNISSIRILYDLILFKIFR
jgi:glycosyltransferase involved in cell wall biosynthesis